MFDELAQVGDATWCQKAMLTFPCQPLLKIDHRRRSVSRSVHYKEALFFSLILLHTTMKRHLDEDKKTDLLDEYSVTIPTGMCFMNNNSREEKNNFIKPMFFAWCHGNRFSGTVCDAAADKRSHDFIQRYGSGVRRYRNLRPLRLIRLPYSSIDYEWDEYLPLLEYLLSTVDKVWSHVTESQRDCIKSHISEFINPDTAHPNRCSFISEEPRKKGTINVDYATAETLCKLGIDGWIRLSDASPGSNEIMLCDPAKCVIEDNEGCRPRDSVLEAKTRRVGFDSNTRRRVRGLFKRKQ